MSNNEEDASRSPHVERPDLGRLSLREGLLSELAADYVASFEVVKPDLKPFVGAQPKLLREPQIFTVAETKARTAIASDKIRQAIVNAKSVLIVFHQDASYTPTCRSLLSAAVEKEGGAFEDDDDVVALGTDWIHCIPSRSNTPATPVRKHDQELLIIVGTSSKYCNLCLNDPTMATLDAACDSNNLIVIAQSAIMLPLGSQEQNIFGADSDKVLEAVADALQERVRKRNNNTDGQHRPLVWGHGPNTKNVMLSWAFLHLPVAVRLHYNARVQPFPDPLDEQSSPEGPTLLGAGVKGEPDTVFDHIADYISFQNGIKQALGPGMRVLNFYDSGLNVSVAQRYALKKGVSLLMNQDGLAMNRDASIGHTLSKLNQFVAVDPYKSRKGIYSFFAGDGACRLNGGGELAFYLHDRFFNPKHVASGAAAKSFTTLFIFVDEKWSVEDNLIQQSVSQHKLHNRSFYELLSQSPNVTLCRGAAELRQTVCQLTEQQRAYVQDDSAPGQFQVVLLTDIHFPMPPAILPDTNTGESAEVGFLRATLGAFAVGCELPIPIYGCSAYEYLQFLHAFMKGTPEGSKYQYITAMTDIQASHLAGFDHEEGKSVLFINDVFGIHSLGESLRMNQSGLGDNGRQLIIFVWHPTLTSTSDHFQPHRPPMVWPSVSKILAQFYVLKESDAAFFDFDGTSENVEEIKARMDSKTRLILINMLPEQERNFVGLDIRVKVSNK